MSDYDHAAGYGAAAGQGHGQHGHGHEHEHEHGHEHGRPRYLRVFKRLQRDRLVLLEHGMNTFPLVDLYELGSFTVASSADDTTESARVQFYLYHTTDRRARIHPAGGGFQEFKLEDEAASRIPFEAALRAHGVPCDDDRHLGDAVVEFWKAFFSPPSDPFDETSYANSRWLDTNVGDRRTVGELKRGGGWDDLWLLFRPRKSVNWPVAGAERVFVEVAQQVRTEQGIRLAATGQDLPSPPGVAVVQLGLNTLGLRLLPGGPEEVPVMVLLRA
ncbi:MAG TPA: hypothetical protein VEX86_13555 [Longimicrobium sp.]|nr:hypothetical protein [Longimicrobium sp.]